ncbi:S-protein homolog 29-like [Pistacia vera]|uniref:S-protein homolog 29-like n=2 Tax=Pistacia vera TaxID=55513 RepID=UPI0012638BDF|nr:S-protein homolog 29-like [Pistacia vera]
MGKNLAILVMVLILMRITNASIDDIPVTTVRIQNDLGDGIHLKIHCKSGDDDLGEKDFASGQFTEWKFTANVFLRNTLFFCKMKWNNVEGSFDVYRYTRDESRCLKCLWSIKKDGAYSYAQHPNQKWERLYEWKK